jgi:hypothetical protein
MKTQEIPMPTDTIRKRRNRRDAYLDDDVVRDGEIIRTPMVLADHAMIDAIHRAHPPRIAYKRGYCTDVNTGFIVDRRAPATSPTVRGALNTAPTESSEPPRNDWPTSQIGAYNTWGFAPGQPCTTVEGRRGTLCPHPSNSSILICMPDNSRDAAMDGTSAYFAMKDSLADAWRAFGPRRDSCCSGCAPRDQQGNEPGFVGPPQLAWPQGQHAGQQCTVNGAAGHIEKRGDQFVCIPDRDGRDAEIVAPQGTYPVGGSWPEGCACDLGNGEYGVLVKEGDRLVCRARQVGNGDASLAAAEARRDAAYAQMCRDAEQAWRNP